MLFTAAFFTTGGAPVPGFGSNAAIVPSARVADVVERRDVDARARRRAGGSRSWRSEASPSAAHQRGDEHFPFARGDHVGEQRERLGVHEGHRAADHDERIVLACAPRRGRARPPAAASTRRWCSPTRTRRRRRARRSRGRACRTRPCAAACPRRAAPASSWRAGQEDALAHDVVQLVEEPVDRLEAQVGHSDEVGVRERERDAEAAAVRFADVADFAREDVARAPRRPRGPGSVPYGSGADHPRNASSEDGARASRGYI